MVLWNEEERRMLGLSPKEGKVLDTLSKKGPLNTVGLSFEAKIPRVTSMRLLAALHRRGFVGKQTFKSQIRWSLTEPSHILKRFQQTFEKSDLSIKSALSLSDVASVTVYRGEKELLESNKKFLVSHPGERLLAIEPNAIWKHVAKTSAKDLVELNVLLKKKKIIIEALIEEGYESAITQVEKPVQESFLALLSEFSILPKGSLNSSTEMLIFRDQALFFDWEQLVAVEIKNPSTVKMLKGMFELLKQSARPHK